MSKAPTKKDLKNKVDELEEALKRERAELINFKRRVETDKKQLGDFIRREVINQLLPIFDNIERALSHTPDDLKDHSFVKGVNGVAKQLASELKTLGIERIKTVGKNFDPHLHEAASADGHGKKEIITEELQAGYTMNGEVIRHAIVKVKRQ